MLGELSRVDDVEFLFDRVILFAVLHVSSSTARAARFSEFSNLRTAYQSRLNSFFAAFVNVIFRECKFHVFVSLVLLMDSSQSLWLASSAQFAF